MNRQVNRRSKRESSLTSTADSVSVTSLIEAVKSAVRTADISAAKTDRDLRVAGLELTLQAVATTDLGGAIEFRLPIVGTPFKIGSKTVRRRTHTLRVELTADDLPRYEVRGDPEVEEVLVEAIESIRHVMAAAGGGDDPMSLRAGSVELVFGVTEQGTVTLGANGELTDEITHTLKLDFTPAERP